VSRGRSDFSSAAKPPVFPRLRLVAVAFVLVWLPTYWAVWGWRNFLQLCDVTVLLTTLGLWRGNALLLSSQAAGSLIVNLLWGVDVVARLSAGRHIVGGTEYMWNSAFPAWVRALSLFHVVLPGLHIWCLRRTGYDRRALRWEAGLVAIIFIAARLLARSGTNPNFVFAAPVFHRAFGPARLHVALVWVTEVVLLMLPVHLALRRLLPPARASSG
jgi:hypothetical protein